MSPSSTVHGGQYYTKYQVCDIRVSIPCGIRGGHKQFGATGLNQLVAGSSSSLLRRLRKRLTIIDL